MFNLFINPPDVMASTHRLHLPRWADRLGAFGAFLCALHCALIPVALAVVPALGLGLIAWHRLEWAFSLFATVLAITSLWLGYRNHRAYHAWLLVAPGLALVWGGLLVRHAHDGSAVHASVMAAGGLLIGAAHLVNLRLSFGHAH